MANDGSSDRQDHLEQLIRQAGVAINETFKTWQSRRTVGPLGLQTADLDQFAAQCAGVSEMLDLIGQRASQVASELLEDDDD